MQGSHFVVENCILFAVNNALIPPERVFVKRRFSVELWRKENRVQWKFIFLGSQVTARNYYVNVEELVKESEALLIGDVKASMAMALKLPFY